MKKLWLHTAKDYKGKVAIQELGRAHLIIALLALALAFFVMISALYPIELNQKLASLSTALLIIVAAISLSTALAIRSKK